MKKKRLTRAQQDQLLRILLPLGTFKKLCRFAQCSEEMPLQSLKFMIAEHDNAISESEPEGLGAFFAAQITPSERNYCELEGLCVVDFMQAKLAN